MFRRVLIANRGVAACRILRTLRRLGIASVAVFSEADRHALHVRQADEAQAIGPAPAAQSYLAIDRLLAAARASGADAVHPGYGFLAENADFAEACEAAGLAWIGPRPAHIRAFGLKHRAREIAAAAGVPLAPGSGLLTDVAAARAAADAIGYPVMLKSTAGGGGIGLLLCPDAGTLDAAFARIAMLAQVHFSDGGVFVERAVPGGRHVEVQIFGDGRGGVLVLGDRDCSAQRRNQKIVEETPAPFLPEDVRQALHAAAQRLGAAVGYANAGTVEFIYDPVSKNAFFLEVNTRLQVEHGVTEATYGIDLVEWMLCQAAGETLPTLPTPRGHAIEVRLYAEDPAEDFRPSAGRLTRVVFPAGPGMVTSCVAEGSEVTPFYDPMLATVIATGADRADALHALAALLAGTEIDGLETNLPYLRHLLCSGVLAGEVTTTTLGRTRYAPARITVLAPGTETTVQDLPGRLGYWHVGVPPSGPMDAKSFALANRAVGNPRDAAGLEIVVSGPTLRFDGAAVICLAGAELPARCDGVPVPYWTPLEIAAGSVVTIGSGAESGARSYLAVRGGLDVPAYLGSRSTFTLGGFGGHAGRALRTGDVLRWRDEVAAPPAAIPPGERPALASDWTIRVLDGPHGAADFFTPDFLTGADIAAFYGAAWTVHYNSSRTGVRLIGPRPGWARADGGEAGLHPSNIHDTPYAIGAVDFTGDMPVILGPDGPSLGGFVCPVTIIAADLWITGQLRAGDTVRFMRAADLPIVLAERPATDTAPRLLVRRAGEANLLIEFGPEILDLALRLRVHALMQVLAQAAIAGVIDLTPGIRSLQIHFDPDRVTLDAVLRQAIVLAESLPSDEDLAVPSRLVHMPLSWDDPATREAIARYARSVRADAPWCPSNIEFIRRINGLDSVDDVRAIVLAAEYLVLGLGDVYLGAPVATPLDPRHRLVTTKYNPARTWTPENAVGIGGAYLCVYGMEGPGGYQFVGRTCQVWTSFPSDGAPPWKLRFFDRLRFFEVDADTLLRLRDDLPHGQATLAIEEGEFSLHEYRAFLAAHATEIAAFKARRQAAFEAERTRWAAAGAALALPAQAAESHAVPEEGDAVTSPVAGGVWQILVKAGDAVAAGQTLLVLEAMKAEITVAAPRKGTIGSLRCATGDLVAMGQRLLDLL